MTSSGALSISLWQITFITISLHNRINVIEVMHRQDLDNISLLMTLL